MKNFKILFCLVGLLVGYLNTWGQGAIIRPALNHNSLRPVNRDISIQTDKDYGTLVRVQAKPNAGVVWIKDVAFEKGVIEFDVKGKDALQESFVGIAFHAIDDSTYQAVYFRPFNFNASDPERKKHAVQFISLPDHDWPYLREAFPNKYEAPMTSEIDPNSWFHVKVDVREETIEVYVDVEKKPTLVVRTFGAIAPGKIGFWTGNNSDGDFANLKIKTSDMGISE